MRRFRFAAPVLMIALLDTQVALAVEPPSRLFTPEGHGRRGDGYFPDDDVRLITALSDVVTPHIEWAKPIQGGTVRVLAVSHKVDGRWPVELAQRFDFVVTTVYGHAPDSLGAYPERGLFVQGTVDVEARLLQAMNEPIDVIVSNMPLNALGEKVKGRIEELMARHVGYIGPCDGFDRTGWERLDDAAVRMVCDAVPLKGLRLLGGRFASSAAAAGQIMAVWRGPQGQNAVDLSAYPRDGEKPDADRLQFSFLPSVEQEAWCSLMGRAVLWACGRWTSEDAPALALPAQPIDQSGLPLSVPVKPEGVRFQLRIWDEDGRVRKLGDDGVIPRLPAGRYFVGLQAFREDAVARWSLTCLDVAAPVSVAEVVPEKSCVRRDEAVRASVRLSSDPPGGSRLLFEILDNYGRCVFRKEQPAQREAVIEGDARESLHMYNYVNAVLVGADGEAISEKRHAFFIEQPSPPTDDLSMMVWEASASFDPVERQILQRFAGLGANAALRGARNGSMDTTSLEACTMSNVHPIIYVTKLNAPQVGEDGIRQPCITAPDFRELLKSTLARQAQAFAQFSPLAYSLGDDQHYVSPGQDVCWSPSCRARLAAWAQAKYGDLERLNEAWGTTYSSFDDAVPIKSVEALPAARQAPASQYKPLCHWLDHKLFLDTMVADWHREMADAIESTDPGAVAWYDCTVEGWPRPGSGFDFWQLAAKSKFCVNYLNPIVHDIFSNAQRKGTYHGTWYGGYSVYNYAPFYDEDFQPWWCVLHGINLHGLYYGGNSPSYSEERLIAPDLGNTVAFSRIMSNIDELRGGVAKLLFNARPVRDPIAFVYSPASVHLTALLEKDLPKAAEWTGQTTDSVDYIYMQCWEALAMLVRDLGYSYSVIPDSALEVETFLNSSCRVLVMPMNLRATEAQARTVREFARRGGTVIADAFAGVFDGFARANDGGMCADVFGLGTKESFPPKAISLQEVRSVEDVALGEWAIDSGIEIAGATPLAKAADGTPVITVNTFGEGHGIYLNLLARDYQIRRTLAEEMPFRDAFGAALHTYTGLTPAVEAQVRDRSTKGKWHGVQACEFDRFELDGALYVAILRHHKMRPDDSVFNADLRPKPVRVAFGRTAHLYDVRRAMYRGEVDTAEDVLYPGRTELYALLPYEVGTLSLATEKDGNSLLVRGAIEPRSGSVDAKASTHVLHIDIADPSGVKHPEYARNVVAPNGKFSERFFLGLDAAPGLWTITVRDVASGITAKAAVAVAD